MAGGVCGTMSKHGAGWEWGVCSGRTAVRLSGWRCTNEGTSYGGTRYGDMERAPLLNEAVKCVVRLVGLTYCVGHG